mgnify:CR=1 FL=1
MDWQPGEFLVLERNPNWWADEDPLSGDPPGNVSQLTFVFMPEPEEMTDALEGGEVDVIALRPEPETMSALSDVDGVDDSGNGFHSGGYGQDLDGEGDTVGGMLSGRGVEVDLSSRGAGPKRTS